MSNHNNKQRIPISIPNIGGPQQQPFDISEAIKKSCEACSGETFDLSLKLGLISKMAPKNRTGQDVLVKFEVYICRSCGHEYGQPIVLNDGAADERQCSCEHNEPRSLTGRWVCPVHGDVKR